MLKFNECWKSGSRVKLQDAAFTIGYNVGFYNHKNCDCPVKYLKVQEFWFRGVEAGKAKKGN